MTTEEMRVWGAVDTAFPDVHAEMIDGEVCIETVVTSAHGQMAMSVGAQMLAKWCVMTATDTVCDGWRGTTCLRPDIAVADPAYRGTNHDVFPAEKLLLVGEVVSESNPGNDTRRKLTKYAQAGVPCYLVVDPIQGECLLYSLPDNGRYRAKVESKFGDPVSVGAPVDMDIDTSALYTY
ncbi:MULTISPECIES: Uma2 family endonuclease [Streptomyces]|uniref:Uma2 family endonuclease n=1 Tax=Streptomyces TaxID=1883 RepID=UPI00163CD09E|nr:MULTISPECIES: Uma2 family endonuclease [Streptomyces]MBC2874567.1 Uma2 family endonuclease [Streptomyces sp. TYQ1024]UKW29257.1 Uma2 family endonuclease [Streptomyces sp. TYQ1024]